jgi:hypothetical protein
VSQVDRGLGHNLTSSLLPFFGVNRPIPMGRPPGNLEFDSRRQVKPALLFVSASHRWRFEQLTNLLFACLVLFFVIRSIVL